MAVTLNANTSTGFIATSDTSGILQLQTAGTTAVTVDASQNVGIGTASPSGISTYPTLDIRGSAGGGLRYGNATVHGYLYADSNGGQIGTATNSPFVLYSNGLERMRIPAAGGIQSVSSISVGNTAPTASGAGITFPATQSASTDVNTLDDYEEGTWTPSVGGTATYSGQAGSYIKIGRLVTVWFDLQINVIGTGSATSILGLPFTGSGSGQGGSPTYWEALSVTAVYVGMRIDNGSTQILLSGATATTASLNSSFSCFKSTSRLIGTLTYASQS